MFKHSSQSIETRMYRLCKLTVQKNELENALNAYQYGDRAMSYKEDMDNVLKELIERYYHNDELLDESQFNELMAIVGTEDV
jgi:hypothetical protein